MIKSSFSKIGLHKVDPSLSIEQQITSLECDLVEEQYDADENFIRAIEKRIKLRNQFAHIDTLKIFDKLRAHMALICEVQTSELQPEDYGDPMANLDQEVLARGIFVKSIQLSGGNENLRLTMYGFKTLAHENTLDLKSPAIRLDDMDYPFTEQLVDLITDLESEARQAIYEQKGCGQMNLFETAEPGEAPIQKKAKRKALENFADDLLSGIGDGGMVSMVSGTKTVNFTKN